MKWQNFIFLATHKSMFFSTKSISLWERSSINLHYCNFQNPRNGNSVENQKMGISMPAFWIMFWIACCCRDEQSSSAFTVAEDEQSSIFSLPFRVLVGLEHGMLICVSMELQRRSGSQSESEISIGKYGVCILGFAFFFFFCG